MKIIPVRETMCATCPFRPGSPYAALQADLAKSALTEASRVCHSTGLSILQGRTGKPQRICRGARDLQIKTLHAMNFLAEPTDAAWTAKLSEVMACR